MRGTPVARIAPWIAGLCLVATNPTGAAPPPDELGRALRAVQRATVRARQSSRAEALEAVRRLEALTGGARGGRPEVAALYERLYRVHGELEDLHTARERLAHVAGCDAALHRARLLAEAATDLRTARRELADVARDFTDPSCRMQAARGAAVLAAFAAGDLDDPPLPALSSLPAPASGEGPRSPVQAPRALPVAAPGAGEDPAPDGASSPPVAEGLPVIERIALWPEGPSTRVAVYVDRPCPFLVVDEPGGLRLRLPGAALARSVPAERTSTVGIVRGVRMRRGADGVDVLLGVDGAVRYRAFPMAQPYRIVVDVARPEVIALVAASLRPRVRRIVLDAGHGGHDSGARGTRTGIEEKVITLEVARILERLLIERLGVEVVFTRKDDRFVALEERVALANGAGADLFVSIHANAAQNADQSGIETFVLARSNEREALKVAARENRTSVSDVTALGTLLATMGLESHQVPSESLARSIQERLLRRMRARFGEVQDRGVRKAMFYVLVGAHMPAVLVETSFLTNAVEEARLATAAFRRELAEGIYEGVAAFMRQRD